MLQKDLTCILACFYLVKLTMSSLIESFQSQVDFFEGKFEVATMSQKGMNINFSGCHSPSAFNLLPGVISTSESCISTLTDSHAYVLVECNRGFSFSPNLEEYH